MGFQFHTDTDPKQMDAFVINSDQNTLYQCHEWAEIKNNWDSVFTSVTDEEGKIVATALVLIRTVVLNSTLFYIPRGPVMDWRNRELVTFMLDHLKAFAKSRHAMVMRFDPYLVYKRYPIHEKDEPHEEMYTDVISFLKEYGAEHRGFTVMIPEATQPRYNIIMRVDSAWQERLVKNTRQSIRTAEKRGARAYEGTEYISDLAEAMHYTETRKHVALRSADYFRHMADVYGDHALIMVARLNFREEKERLLQQREQMEKQRETETSAKKQKSLDQQIANLNHEIELVEGYMEDENRDEAVLSGKMVCFNEKRMEFFYMGNNTKYLRIRANYYLYSKCIQRCADLNIPICSFGGVDGTLDDGIAMFKAAWPVEVEEYIGEFNLVLNPAAYHLFEKAYPKMLDLAVRIRTRK